MRENQDKSVPPLSLSPADADAVDKAMAAHCDGAEFEPSNDRESKVQSLMKVFATRWIGRRKKSGRRLGEGNHNPSVGRGFRGFRGFRG